MSNSELFDFMRKYYGRDKLENEQDKDLMYKIHNYLFPEDPQEKKTGCEGCAITILKKLQVKYEVLNSHI
jgi:uncharacterized protein with ATP-grasp and redox domains